MIQRIRAELPPKGNPKLDSQLNRLVDAGSLGTVRVIIESMPDQLEAASEAATNAGAKVETSYGNLLQVMVPITSLTTLASATSIRLIRMPQQPLPATTEETRPNILGAGLVLASLFLAIVFLPKYVTQKEKKR